MKQLAPDQNARPAPKAAKWRKPVLKQWDVRDVTQQGGALPPGDAGNNSMLPS